MNMKALARAFRMEAALNTAGLWLPVHPVNLKHHDTALMFWLLLEGQA